MDASRPEPVAAGQSLIQVCRDCGKTKPLIEFDLRADTGSRRTQCKDCRRLRQAARYQANMRASPPLSREVGASQTFPCTACGAQKAASEFPKRSRDGRLHSWCRACFSRYKTERHQRLHEAEMRRIRRNQAAVIAKNRSLLQEYLFRHPCVDCGERDRVVLDFDHVRGSKVADISRLMADGTRWERIAAEIEKCEVRCSNCHRRITKRRRDAYPSDLASEIRENPF